MTRGVESGFRAVRGPRRWRVREIVVESVRAARNSGSVLLLAAVVFGPMLEALRLLLTEIGPLPNRSYRLDVVPGVLPLRIEATISEWLGPFWITGLALTHLHTGLLTLPVLAAVARERLSLRAWLASTALRLPLLLLVSTAISILVLLFFGLVVIPGLALAAAYSIAGVVAVAEGRRPIATMQRTTDLSIGRWLLIFATMVMAHLIRLLLDETSIDPLATLAHANFGEIARTLVSGIGRFLTGSILAIPLIVIYAAQREPTPGLTQERVEDVFG